MDDQQILNICAIHRKMMIGGEDSKGKCGFLCFYLFQILRSLGANASMVIGSIPIYDSRHCWLALDDGRIVDPTADQFSTAELPMPKIYIGQKPSWYRELSPANAEREE